MSVGPGCSTRRNPAYRGIVIGALTKCEGCLTQYHATTRKNRIAGSMLCTHSKAYKAYIIILTCEGEPIMDIGGVALAGRPVQISMGGVMCRDEEDDKDATSYYAALEPGLGGISNFDLKDAIGFKGSSAEQLRRVLASTWRWHHPYAHLIRFCEPMKQGLQLLFACPMPL
jgi:hypothetical protein